METEEIQNMSKISISLFETDEVLLQSKQDFKDSVLRTIDDTNGLLFLHQNNSESFIQPVQPVESLRIISPNDFYSEERIGNCTETLNFGSISMNQLIEPTHYIKYRKDLEDYEEDDEGESDISFSEGNIFDESKFCENYNNRTGDQFWIQRFNDLKEFKQQYGHPNPSYLQHSQLYSWLHRQKFLFRKGRLSKERYNFLNDIGIHFDYHWDEMYVQFKSYREGLSNDFDNKLSSWVWAQIYAWKAGKLSQERIVKLEELGITVDMDTENSISEQLPKPQIKRKRKNFDYSPEMSPQKTAKSESNWLTMFEQLFLYKKAFNSLSVSSKRNKKLNLWVRTQRKNWREGKLAPWREEKLQKLGLTPYFERKSQSNISDGEDSEDFENLEAHLGCLDDHIHRLDSIHEIDYVNVTRMQQLSGDDIEDKQIATRLLSQFSQHTKQEDLDTLNSYLQSKSLSISKHYPTDE